MTVNAINGGAGVSGPEGAGASNWQSRMDTVMGPASKLFNETPEQLLSDLRTSNTSLSAYAQSKGVSQSDLIGAIKDGLQQEASVNGVTLSDSQLTNLANTIANRTHHDHGHHHHHGGAGGVDPNSTTGTTSTTGTQGTGTDADGDNDGH